LTTSVSLSYHFEIREIIKRLPISVNWKYIRWTTSVSQSYSRWTS